MRAGSAAQVQGPQKVQEPHVGRHRPIFHPFPSNGTRDPSERYRRASDLEVPGDFSDWQPAPQCGGARAPGEGGTVSARSPRPQESPSPTEGENEAQSLEGKTRSPREGLRPGSAPKGESHVHPPFRGHLVRTV